MEFTLVRFCTAGVAVIALVGCEQVLGIEDWDAGSTTTGSETMVDADEPLGAGGAATTSGSTGGQGGGASCLPDPSGDPCSDCVLNGEETDVDCGGTVCRPCRPGATCLLAEDCDNGACIDGLCH